MRVRALRTRHSNITTVMLQRACQRQPRKTQSLGSQQPFLQWRQGKETQFHGSQFRVETKHLPKWLMLMIVLM